MKIKYLIPILLVVLVFSFGFSGCCFGSGSSNETIPTPTTSYIPDKIKVDYEFTGTAKGVSITYSNENGDTEQQANRKNGQRISIGRVPVSNFLYISAQNDYDTGTVIVNIYVDGKLFKTSKSDGEYVIATASGVYGQ